MAYSRSRNRSRSRGAQNAPMVASPHTPILTVGVLVAVGLSCFGLPGMPVLLAAVTVAWLAAKAPQLTGTDPWKRTCANTPAEQRRDTSYKWMRSWFRHLSRNLDPRNPMATLTVGVACLMGALVWARCGAWWAWVNMASTLILIGARPTRPARLIATGQRPVTWARKHLAAIAMCMLIGVLAGLALWMVTDNPWFIPAMVCLLAPLPMRRAWLAVRRQAKRDREAAAMLTGWLLALDKAVVDQPPYRLDNTVHGEHGEIVCRLAVSRALNANQFLRLIFGTEDGIQPLRVSEGWTLVNAGSRNIVPDANARASMTGRIQQWAMFMIVSGAFSAVEGRDGVVAVDEAWSILEPSSPTCSLIDQKLRLARSMRVMPVFASQKVGEFIGANMVGGFSRAFLLSMSDTSDEVASPARLALKLLDIRDENNIILNRMRADAEKDNGEPNWVSLKALYKQGTRDNIRGAVSYFIDGEKQPTPVEDVIPTELLRKISTNAVDKRNRINSKQPAV